MKTIKGVSYSDLMDYMEKNDGEYIDTLPGSLIDDLMISVEAGTLVCFETYQNAWSSVYTVFFYPVDEDRDAWIKWDSRREAFIKEYGEEALL